LPKFGDFAKSYPWLGEEATFPLVEIGAVPGWPGDLSGSFMKAESLPSTPSATRGADFFCIQESLNFISSRKLSSPLGIEKRETNQ
jgi:hypothetical protein